MVERKLNKNPNHSDLRKENLKINVHDARELIGSMSEAKIVLDDQIYLLRITKQNKLILTK